jgi:N-dimethylarginine dimethylaminohydrolase
MTMDKFNEYSQIGAVAVRRPEQAFIHDLKIDGEWEELRFHSKPDLEEAIREHQSFVDMLRDNGAAVINLPKNPHITLDSLYARDATLVSPKGLILCNMGRFSRCGEPKVNSEALLATGFVVAGTIDGPGTVEGGDFIWLDNNTAAVGMGTRTNKEGIRQLKLLLGDDVELHVVPLPDPEEMGWHPEDVFHLMSMISPIDKDLAVIYRPLMPKPFIGWLENRGMAFIELPEADYLNMACNILAIAPRKVVMLEGLPTTKALLEKAGVTVITYKGEEISRKGEGGPTCLTRPLVRI